jgi:hypothetical protein
MVSMQYSISKVFLQLWHHGLPANRTVATPPALATNHYLYTTGHWIKRVNQEMS